MHPPLPPVPVPQPPWNPPFPRDEDVGRSSPSLLHAQRSEPHSLAGSLARLLARSLPGSCLTSRPHRKICLPPPRCAAHHTWPRSLATPHLQMHSPGDEQDTQIPSKAPSPKEGLNLGGCEKKKYKFRGRGCLKRSSGGLLKTLI